jgi:hypothetical protein
MVAAMQEQLRLRQQREQQDLAQSLVVRGLENSTIGDQARRDLESQQANDMVALGGQLYNQILPTQINALQGLQGMDLSARQQAIGTLLNAMNTQEGLQQGQYGRALGARQLGGQEQAQLFGQGMGLRQLGGQEQAQQFGQEMATRQLGGQEQAQLFGQGMQTRQQGVGELLNAIQSLQGLSGQEFSQGAQQRNIALNELMQPLQFQAGLESQGIQQGMGAQGLGFSQDQQTRAFQNAMLQAIQGQTAQERSQSLAEFIALLNAQMGLDTTAFNQSNQSIGQMLAAMGMASVPQNVPGYTIPTPGISGAQAFGNLLGNMGTSAMGTEGFWNMFK